jgi:hypothetical protein
MHYKRAETISMAPYPRSLGPMSGPHVLRGVSVDAHDVEAFWQAISLQAAVRTAAFAKGSEAPQGRDQLDLEEDVSPRRSSKLVLALAIGIAVFACVTYFVVGRNLLPALSS